MATPPPPPPSPPSQPSASNHETSPNPEPSLPSYGSPQPSQAQAPSTVGPDSNDRFANAPEVATNHDAFANAPEVVPNQEKLLPPGYKPPDSAGLIPSDYDESADYAPEPVSTLNDSSAAGASHAGASRAGKVCGLKRKTFFIVLAAAIVLVVGAIVGGVVGGLYANGQMPGSSPPKSTSTGKPDPPQETGPIEPSERNMAAALSLGEGPNKPRHLQVFYQDLNESRILYRAVDDDEPGDEQTVDLDIEPSWGTPLAATGLSAGDRMAQLFYLSLDGSDTNIIQATLNCTKDPCVTKSNYEISTNISGTVDASSKLAALRLLDEDRDRVRVYYQASGGHIWALAVDGNGADQWSANHVMAGAYSGTSLVAIGPNATEINLYFVSETSERLRVLTYDDSQGPPSDGDTSVDDSPGSGWSPSATLAGVYVSEGAPWRIYYGDRSGDDRIVAWWRDVNSDSYQTNQDDAWGSPQGGFTAVSWSDNTRLYYFDDGELVVNIQEGTEWEDVEPLDDAE